MRRVLILAAVLISWLGAVTEAEEIQAGSMEETVDRSQRASALDWYKQGLKLARQGEYQAALSRFERARSLAPHWALPHLEIAVAHLMTDNDPKLIEPELKQAVELGQDIPRAHYLYGKFLQEQGRRSEAIHSLIRALQYRPSLVDARFRLAGLYVEEGRQSEGIHQLELVLHWRPSHLGAHRRLAVLFEQSGHLEEAERHLKMITSLHPNNVYHLSKLASFYRRAGWRAKAKAASRHAERLSNSGQRRKLRPLLRSREPRHFQRPTLDKPSSVESDQFD